jgi:hypothetical protein
MSDEEAQKLLDKIIGQIFGFQNPFTLSQFLTKYAFDVRLPQKVQDSTTGQETWASSINPTKFITMDNCRKFGPSGGGEWLIPKREIKSLVDILEAWNETNMMATERLIESINVSQSDAINYSENVYRSQDIHSSKYVLFCDSSIQVENSAAVQRSNNVNYSIRVEDSKNIDQSFAVNWSNKITKSLFIQDCFDMYECIFCSHLASKKFCIANMQFTEEEYFKHKDPIVKWILSS